MLQDSIVALSCLPKLRRLTLSSDIDDHTRAFFPRSTAWGGYSKEKRYKKYSPESFEVAVRDLANGCQTLDTIAMSKAIGDL